LDHTVPKDNSGLDRGRRGWFRADTDRSRGNGGGRAVDGLQGNGCGGGRNLYRRRRLRGGRSGRVRRSRNVRMVTVPGRTRSPSRVFQLVRSCVRGSWKTKQMIRWNVWSQCTRGLGTSHQRSRPTVLEVSGHRTGDLDKLVEPVTHVLNARQLIDGRRLQGGLLCKMLAESGDVRWRHPRCPRSRSEGTCI
jgi:hypothetical protein